MLDLSPDKIAMLAVVALVVLGPNRLPQAARTFGRFVGQMRAMSASLQTEVRDALDPDDTFSKAVKDFNPTQIRRTVRQTVTETIAPTSSNMPAGTTSSAIPVRRAEVAGTPESGWPEAGAPDDPSLN